MNNTSVDSYLKDGCGRCEHYQTPACKVHRWTDELVALRAILLEAGLTETMKWGAPCYTIDGKNVLMLSSLVSHCAIGFFKGAVLPDEDGVLERPGPNSHIMRTVTFRSIDEVHAKRPAVDRLLVHAIEATRAGVEVPRAPREPMPDELQARLDDDPVLSEAFAELTPGRQRSHILYVSSAKQSKTRESRVERCAPKILAGRGFNER